MYSFNKHISIICYRPIIFLVVVKTGVTEKALWGARFLTCPQFFSTAQALFGTPSPAARPRERLPVPMRPCATAALQVCSWHRGPSHRHICSWDSLAGDPVSPRPLRTGPAPKAFAAPGGPAPTFPPGVIHAPSLPPPGGPRPSHRLTLVPASSPGFSAPTRPAHYSPFSLNRNFSAERSEFHLTPDPIYPESPQETTG